MNHFRPHPRHYAEDDPLQPALDLPGFYNREVSWRQGSIVERRRFLGRSATLQSTNYGSDLVRGTYLDAADISLIKDPDLRYALCFADAAAALGSQCDGYGSSHQTVWITATNEGANSKLLNCEYSGGDSFMEDLRSAQPSK